ncbi:MAG: hypothetical protein QM778_23735 [Myxococcales bacterium]
MKGITWHSTLGLLLAACTFELDVNTPRMHASDARVEADAGDGDGDGDGQGDAGADASMDASPQVHPTPPAQHEDAGGLDMDAGTDASALPAVRHPSCVYAFPATRPPAPGLPHDLTGRPIFDLWRELDCAVVDDYPLCSPGQLVPSASWNCDLCLLGEDDAGVCAGQGPANNPGCGWMTSHDGACGACAPLAAKARACCAKLPGFDCRTWPFERPSKAGEVCADHEDCEPGLVCVIAGTGFAQCACPGAGLPSSAVTCTSSLENDTP